MGYTIKRLYCSIEFLDSFLNIANHQFYRESSPVPVSTSQGTAECTLS
jgi:hypothetical protein